MKLSLKLVSLVLSAALALGSVLSLAMIERLRGNLLAALQNHGEQMAVALSETQLAQFGDNNSGAMDELLRRVTSSGSSLAYAYITDFNGVVFARSFNGDIPDAVRHPESRHSTEGTDRKFLSLNGTPILEISRQLLPGMATRIHIGLNAKTMQAELAWARWHILGSILLFGFTISAAMILLGQRILNPGQTSKASQLAGEGGENLPVHEGLLRHRGGDGNCVADNLVRKKTPCENCNDRLHSERHFIDGMLDNAGVLMLVLDMDGHIRRFNRACETLSGYSSEEVEGRCVWDFLLLAEERDEVKAEAFKGLVDNPQERSGRYLNHWMTKSGKTHLIEWYNSVLPGERGSNEYVISIGIDVTERRHVEADLRRFKTTLDMTQDCVFMFAPGTLRFFYVNQGATAQVGYSGDELMQMTPVDIKPDYDETDFREIIAPLLAGERSSVLNPATAIKTVTMWKWKYCCNT